MLGRILSPIYNIGCEEKQAAKYAADYLLGIMRATFFIALFVARLSIFADEPQPAQTDADLRQKILGTWTSDARVGDGTNAVSAVETETYFAGGRYTAHVAHNDAGDKWDEDLKGSWSVESGILRVSASGAKRWKDYYIVRADDTSLVLRWHPIRSGEQIYTQTERRIK